MNKKVSAAVEVIKTLLLVVLFACVVIMSFLYFYRFQSEKPNATSSVDFDILGKLQAESMEEASIARTDIQPETIAVKKNGSHTYAISKGTGFVSDIYELVSRDLSVVLGNACECEKSTAPDELWNNAIASDDFIYVRYHSPLPSSIIYMHSVTDNTLLSAVADGETPLIYEIFIFPDKTLSEEKSESGEHQPEDDRTDAYAAAVRDTFGNVYIFTLKNTDKELPVSSEDFDIYIDAAALELADFRANLSGKEKSVLPSTVIYLNGLNAAEISFGEPTLISEAEITSLLGINPDKTGSYYDNTTESSVFVATHGTLSIGKIKTVYKTDNSENGGVSISTFLNKTNDNGHYSVADGIVAAEKIAARISEFDGTPLGGNADILLSSIYLENSTLTVEYKYYYDNIEVMRDVIACRIEIKNGKLVGLEITPAEVAKDINGTRRRCLSPAWVLSAFLDNRTESETDGLYTIIFCYTTDTENETLMNAEWMPIQIH